MRRTKRQSETKTYRVSACITTQYRNLITEVSSATGMSASAIIEQALATFHPAVTASRQRPRMLLRETDLIGIGRGGRDLSSNCKSALAESVCKKQRS